MSTTTVTVKGMTCGHCVTSVKAALAELDGVRSVGVDLLSGQVDIRSDSPLDPASVAVAVDDAGYEVVS